MVFIIVLDCDVVTLLPNKGSPSVYLHKAHDVP